MGILDDIESRYQKAVSEANKDKENRLYDYYLLFSVYEAINNSNDFNTRMCNKEDYVEIEIGYAYHQLIYHIHIRIWDGKYRLTPHHVSFDIDDNAPRRIVEHLHATRVKWKIERDNLANRILDAVGDKNE